MTPLRSRRITANLLTGFLGSGKTSLLKRLLARPDLGETAVLINELGEVGLDHLLVEEVNEEVVLLKSGCVCCTIRGDLKDALVRLHERRQRGEVPPFSRVVIETTGLADPAPVVATMLVDPMLRHHFQVGNIVTVVDAVAGAKNLERHPEAMRQVAAADRLVISKTDLAAQSKVDALRLRLAGINPSADLLESDEAAEVDAALLTRDIHSRRAQLGQVRGWLAAEVSTSYDGTHRHAQVSSLMLTADAPLDWARFGLWLSMLLNRHGAKILRLKGLVAIEGADTPVVVQGVQHMIHKPVHLKAWPDADRRTRLVVIAEGIDPALMRRSFAAFTQPRAAAADAVRADQRTTGSLPRSNQLLDRLAGSH